MYWTGLRVCEVIQTITYVTAMSSFGALHAISERKLSRASIFFLLFGTVKSLGCVLMLVAHALTNPALVILSFCMSTASIGLLQLMSFKLVDRGAKVFTSNGAPLRSRWSRVRDTLIFAAIGVACVGYIELLMDNVQTALSFVRASCIMYALNIALMLSLLFFWAFNVPRRYCKNCVPYLYATLVASLLFVVRVTFEFYALFGHYDVAGMFNILDGPLLLVVGMVILPDVCVVVTYITASLYVRHTILTVCRHSNMANTKFRL